MGLVAAVRHFARIGARRVHQGNDGQIAARIRPDHVHREIVMLRHPDAVLHRTLLGEHAKPPPRALYLGLEHGRVERAVQALLHQIPTRGRQKFASSDPARVFGRRHRAADVLVDLEGGETLEGPADAPVGDQAGDAPGAAGDLPITGSREQRERTRRLFRLTEQRVYVATRRIRLTLKQNRHANRLLYPVHGR